MAIGSVSVVVPHYNRPDLVRRALESIRVQTVAPAEVLLVDDHSRPENREKLKALSHFATLLETPENLGMAGTRNHGAKQAKGEWLAFLDDDDCWVPDKLERQIQYLKDHPSAVALGSGMTMVTPDGHEEYWGKKPTRRLTLAHSLCYTAAMAQGLLIRRDVFLDLGGFNPHLRHFEDYEFGIRLLASGHETHFLAEPLFIYYRGGREQVSLQWQKMFSAELRVLRMHRNLIRKEFGPLGLNRLRARCLKKYGLWKGGIVGRSVWAWGCVLQTILGGNSRDPAGDIRNSSARAAETLG